MSRVESTLVFNTNKKGKIRKGNLGVNKSKLISLLRKFFSLIHLPQIRVESIYDYHPPLHALRFNIFTLVMGITEERERDTLKG